MKIMYVTPQWGDTIGGPRDYVKNLRKEIDLSVNKTYVMSIKNSGADFEFKENNLLSYLKQILVYTKIRPDIIHIQGRIKYILPAALYSKIFGAKLIFTFHTQAVVFDYFKNSEINKGAYFGIKGRMGSILLKLTSVTAVSKNIIDVINEKTKINISKYKIIPSGANVDISDYKNITIKKNKVKGDVLKLSSIGVFSWDWKIKGHMIAVDAIYNLIKNKKIKAELHIAGDGAYRNNIENYIKSKNMSEAIILHGYVNDIENFLNETDYYLHTGLNEGCPLSILQAMSANKLCIAINKGGVSEIIEDGINGYLCEDNADDLASKIEHILQLEESDHQKIKANAIIKINKFYSWKHIAQQYLKVYTAKDDQPQKKL